MTLSRILFASAMVLALVLSSKAAFAKGNADPAAASDSIASPKSDDQALCTSENSGQKQVSDGYCMTLRETFADENSCAGKALTQIMNERSNGTAISDMGQFCSSYGSFTSRSDRSTFYINLVAALVQEESGWNTNISEKGGSGKGRGLCQINADEGAKTGSTYEDCQQINPNTVDDGHKNLICCACIVMKNIAKDGKIATGSVKAKNAQGAAAYFGSLNDNQGDNHDDKKVRIAQATNRYCEARAGSGGGNTQMAFAQESDPTSLINAVTNVVRSSREPASAGR